MARIIGIDHALNDIVLDVKTSFLNKINLKKGDRRTITMKELEKILPMIERSQISAGGTIRNVIKDLSSFGESAGIMAAVGNDSQGKKYRESLGNAEDMISTFPGKTGIAVTYLTEEKERSFQTYLGVSTKLSRESIERRIKEGIFDEAELLAVSGFSFENKKEPIYSAACHALNYANDHGIKIALGLGGMKFLKKNKSTILNIIRTYNVNIISLNEDEANVLTGSRSYDESAEKLIPYCRILVITRGSNGLMISTDYSQSMSKAFPLDRSKFKSKNGAGDAVLAAIIHEYINNTSFDEDVAGKMAARMAREAMYSDTASINKRINYKKIRSELTR